MSNVPKLQRYIPVNDKNTCNITDLQLCVYGAKFKCISNWYTALLMHAYLNSYSIKKVLNTCFPRLKKTITLQPCLKLTNHSIGIVMYLHVSVYGRMH